MDCSPPDSSVHGIFQARILEWVAIFPTQGLNPGFLHCRQILYCLGQKVPSKSDLRWQKEAIHWLIDTINKNDLIQLAPPTWKAKYKFARNGTLVKQKWSQGKLWDRIMGMNRRPSSAQSGGRSPHSEVEQPLRWIRALESSIWTKTYPKIRWDWTSFQPGILQSHACFPNGKTPPFPPPSPLLQRRGLRLRKGG